jgi:glycine oxidase
LPINLQPDYLIVGQGLAGTLLSYFLIKEGKKVLVIGKSLPGASSECAAGIVNPVTGRRYAKSWRYDELFPFAKTVYKELEQFLNIPIWHEMNILRVFQNLIDQNEWDRRSSYPEYKPYIVEPPELGNFSGKVAIEKPFGELRYCSQVAVPQLIHAFQEYLEGNSMFLEEVFNFEDLYVTDNQLFYKSIRPEKIVFCEGAQAIHNPFFNHLPFSVTKGELLLVRIPNVDFNKMLKCRLFLVPLGKDLFWVGSTSRFEFENSEPTEQNGEWLRSNLKEILKVPYEILDHKAAIRPTVFDIRPFLGAHLLHSSLFIFNGLGTKGAVLGPYFANQMVMFMCGKTSLESDVDINRFSSK